MKYRILSVLTALALCLGLLPGTALAEGGPQAQVGDTTYATVQEAFDAAAALDACTVELLAAVDLGAQTVTMTGGDVTLTSPEGAGFYKYTLTGSGDKTLVVRGGTLTLEDVMVDNTNENGTAIQVPENSAPNITVEASAKVTAFADGIEQKGGSLVVSGEVGVSGNGTGAIGIQNTTVTVKEGADIYSASTLGLFQESGVLTVEGGTISGETFGMFFNAPGGQKPEVHLSGGMFSAMNSTGSAIYLLGDNWKLRELLADGCELCKGGAPLTEEELDGYRTGSGIYTVQESELDLGTKTDEATGAGYSWEDVEVNGSGDITKGTLVLSAGFSRGTVILPGNGADVTVRALGDCHIGTLDYKGNTDSTSIHLTLEGGKLTIAERVNFSGGNDSSITVAPGAVVEALGGISVATSGGANGTVTVNGTLTARSEAADSAAITTGKVSVGPSGALNVFAPTGLQLGGMNKEDPDKGTVIDFIEAFRLDSGGRFTGDCANNIVFAQKYTGAAFEEGVSAGDIIVFPPGYLPQELQPQFNGGRTVVLIPGGGPFSIVPPAHKHRWSADWTANETHHWHVCAASGCTVTEDSQKDGYGAHVYDGARDPDCNVCGHVRALPPLETPSSSGGSSGGSGESRPVFPITVEPAEHGRASADRASASGGVSVTVTVSPDSGYELEALTASDSRGNALKLTDRGGGKYAFLMPEASVTVKAVFAPLPEDCPSRAFTDLGGPGTWYHEAVDFVLRSGLMNGYGNSLFKPDNTLTRAQLVQTLYNHAGKPAASGESGFADVAPGAWCAPAVAWAAERGVAGGYGDGTFGPDDPITREQLAVMLWRYAGSPAAGEASQFQDAGEISPHAREALGWAVETGVMSGRGGGVLDPKGPATRAQAAQMLKNHLDA